MKIGLVLSGGGGKGAYELGVFKALVELGIDKYINYFSGTSIGALNSVLFAQGDMYLAEALWEEVTMDKLLPISKFELFKKGIGLIIGERNITLAKKILVDKMEEGAVTKDGAMEIIDKYLYINKVKEREKICYVTCTEMPDFNARYFKLNDYSEEDAKKMVLASASLPLIYEATEVFEHKYYDGGMCDNTPIEPLYEEGCDIIIVVFLSKECKVDKSKYPNSKFIEIAPRNLEENVLTGVLNLDETAKRNRIKEGYTDAINILEPIKLLISYQIKEEEKEKNPKLFGLYNWVKALKND